MPLYQKPFLTLDQQIQLLIDRGMEITDRPKAKAYLGRIGYYRLSAYWYPFRKSQTRLDAATGLPVVQVLDDFKDGTDFPTLLALYLFDKQLRLLMLDALERIEVAVRTQIALCLGAKHPLAHRQPRYLHGNFARRPSRQNAQQTRHQDWLSRQERKFLDSREDFAIHFKTKYPGEYPPIWIDVELWDFGALSHLFGGLTVADGDAIASAYGLPLAIPAHAHRQLQTWLRCLNDIRNICAHHSRLWNRPLVNAPSWPRPSELPQLAHIAGNTQSQSRLYAALLVTQHLMKTINPTSSWGRRVATHMMTLPVSPHLRLSSSGFPAGWDQEPIWQ